MFLNFKNILNKDPYNSMINIKDYFYFSKVKDLENFWLDFVCSLQGRDLNVCKGFILSYLLLKISSNSALHASLFSLKRRVHVCPCLCNSSFL